METEELVNIKWQLTSKTIRIKQQGQPSILRKYVQPADKPSREEEKTTEEHRRQVDFRSGYQPVARLLPETGGSLQAANAPGLGQLLYYMPSINQQRESETVMELSSFLDMSRHVGSFSGVTKRCWLAELVDTTSDSKVICLFSTQLTQPSQTTTKQEIPTKDDDSALLMPIPKRPRNGNTRYGMTPAFGSCWLKKPAITGNHFITPCHVRKKNY